MESLTQQNTLKPLGLKVYKPGGVKKSDGNLIKNLIKNVESNVGVCFCEFLFCTETPNENKEFK